MKDCTLCNTGGAVARNGECAYCHRNPKQEARQEAQRVREARAQERREAREERQGEQADMEQFLAYWERTGKTSLLRDGTV